MRLPSGQHLGGKPTWVTCRLLKNTKALNRMASGVRASNVPCMIVAVMWMGSCAAVRGWQAWAAAAALQVAGDLHSSD